MSTDSFVGTLARRQHQTLPSLAQCRADVFSGSSVHVFTADAFIIPCCIDDAGLQPHLASFVIAHLEALAPAFRQPYLLANARLNGLSQATPQEHLRFASKHHNMIKGQRFQVNLDADERQDNNHAETQPSGAFIGDVLERQPAAPRPPTAPILKSNLSGFPEHRKRNAESRFRQKINADAPHDVGQSLSSGMRGAHQHTGNGEVKSKAWEAEEKGRIDRENRQKLADMSPAAIEQERAELMSGLSPALIQRLLNRSNIQSGSNETDLQAEATESTQSTNETKPSRFVRLANAREASVAKENDVRETPATDPSPFDSMHFPRPPQPPDLDPSSATFFEDLHSKYFPSLPSDPDKLEWMQSSTPTKSAYDPTAAAFSAKDLRFSFKGELIAPKTALDIPVTEGLHHHGDAPDAAGYTVPELALLARSSYAAQRCIAFQTLGRFLYRLGRGEFGDAGEPGADTVRAEDTFGELARGLWREVERERVIETLVGESEGQGVDGGRHVSAKAYATEAVWLWRKGGGRRWKAE